MADPNKYKSVSVPKETYETLEWLRKGNHAEMDWMKKRKENRVKSSMNFSLLLCL